MDYENLAMQLIIHAGNAKSLAMMAIQHAKDGEIRVARERIKESDNAMTEAHKFQTEALQLSLSNPEEGINMLMAHAQDHLMNALTTQAMAQEFIELYEEIKGLKETVRRERE